jgi:hypothetical protein
MHVAVPADTSTASLVETFLDRLRDVGRDLGSR